MFISHPCSLYRFALNWIRSFSDLESPISRALVRGTLVSGGVASLGPFSLGSAPCLSSSSTIPSVPGPFSIAAISAPEPLTIAPCSIRKLILRNVTSALISCWSLHSLHYLRGRSFFTYLVLPRISRCYARHHAHTPVYWYMPHISADTRRTRSDCSITLSWAETARWGSHTNVQVAAARNILSLACGSFVRRRESLGLRPGIEFPMYAANHD